MKLFYAVSHQFIGILSCHILQEIVLRRSNAEVKLGLTLCYETDSIDGLTDIFIDDIHPDGLAKKDGRLRLGDQIIQVTYDYLLE